MRTTAFLLLAALTALAGGGCKKSDPTNAGGGPAGIEGTYLVTEFEFGGEKAPPDMFAFFVGKDEAERTVTITKDTITFKGKKGAKDEPAAYKIDASKTPGEIDLIEPKDKSETSYGIYKLEGDTLTILIGSAKDPKDRPKEFKTKSKSEEVMFTMKRK